MRTETPLRVPGHTSRRRCHHKTNQAILGSRHLAQCFAFRFQGASGTNWSSPKPELALLDIHFPPAKAHAFGFQPQPLLDRRIPAQFDFSTCAEHALPRQFKAAMQNLRHLPRSSWQSGGSRNRSVGGNFSFGDLPNRRLNAHPHLRRWIGLRGPIRRHRARRSRPFLHSEIHPMRISHNDPTNTSTHKIIPCNKGRGPTRLSVAIEMPVPIKNNVAVNPIFATFTARE